MLQNIKTMKKLKELQGICYVCGRRKVKDECSGCGYIPYLCDCTSKA